jgi:hypothetical protein
MIFAAGTWIGGLVGFLTALMTYLYLYDAFRPPIPNPSWWQRTFGGGGPSGFKTAAKAASLIAVWFGGPILKLKMVD